jgi:hypothetical protein
MISTFLPFRFLSPPSFVFTKFLISPRIKQPFTPKFIRDLFHSIISLEGKNFKNSNGTYINETGPFTI